MGKRARIFHVVQYINNPKTGEPLLDWGHTLEVLGKYKTFHEWAAIMHDKDIYSQADEDAQVIGLNEQYKRQTIVDKAEYTEQGAEAFVQANQFVFANKGKPDHVHIAIRTKTSVDVDTIAKMLGIEPQYIDLPKGGMRAFADILSYLVHEDDKQQLKGKYRYDDSEVRSNFDWRGFLTDRAEKYMRNGQELTPEQVMMYDVRYNGKLLKTCKAEDPVMYMALEKKLKDMRREYLSDLPAPDVRSNYYVCGKGGEGKSLLSKALARQLYRQMHPELSDEYIDSLENEDIFYTIADKRVTFDGYNGQEIIIWDDFRAYDVRDALGGTQGGLYSFLDPYPSKTLRNIKYGAVSVCNKVNIFNSVQPWREFLDGLAGEYTTSDGVQRKAEDKAQAYRRFPFIFPLHEEDYEFLINCGWADNSTDYLHYYNYGRFVGNCALIRQKYGKDIVMVSAAEKEMLLPAINKKDDPSGAKSIVSVDTGKSSPIVERPTVGVQEEMPEWTSVADVEVLPKSSKQEVNPDSVELALEGLRIALNLAEDDEKWLSLKAQNLGVLARQETFADFMELDDDDDELPF